MRSQIGKKLLLFAFILGLTQIPLFIRHIFFISDNTSQNDTLVSLVFPFFHNCMLLILPLLALRVFPTLSNFKLTWIGKPHTKLRWYCLLTLMAIITTISIGLISKTTGIQTSNPFVYKDITVLTPSFFVLLTIILVIIIPIIEEIFWRGYVQEQLKQCFGDKISIILQALLFALFHWYLWLGFIQIFILGLIFGVWRHKRHTLLPIIVAHMAWNGLWSLAHIPDQYEMSKVNITCNYVEKLNNIGNIIPAEDNASLFYEKACRLFVEPEEDLDFLKGTLWINQLTFLQKESLRDWIQQNQEALIQLKQGASKRSCWTDYTGDSMMEIDSFQDLWILRQLAEVVCWNAQLLAKEGEIKAAIDELATCYRIGQHLSEGPKPDLSQVVGFALKRKACNAGQIILEHCILTSEEIESSYSQFFTLFEPGFSFLNITAEHLSALDTIQRIFTDDGNGDGHIPKLERLNYNSKMTQVLYNGLTEETVEKMNRSKRKETVEMTNTLFKSFDRLLTNTPFELFKQNIDIEDFVFETAGNNIISLFLPTFSTAHHIYYDSIAREKAFLLTLAIFHYKAIHAELPDFLIDLPDSICLTDLPNDPYSDQDFIYEAKGDGFILYSPGRNFEDNGGDFRDDLVFWPIEYDDIN